MTKEGQRCHNSYLMLLCLGLLVLVPMYSDAQVNAKFVNEFKEKDVELGHTFSGKLVFWPTSLSKDFFRSLEGEEIAESFYISKIYSIETSKNNADAVELNALFTITKKVESGDSRLVRINEKNIQFESPDLNVKSSKMQDQKGFAYINQSLVRQTAWLLWGLLCGGVLIGGGWIGRKKLREKRERERLIKRYEWWQDYFQKSQDRSDFEYIYDNRRDWLQLIDVKSPAVHNFLNLVYELQFKKSWDKEDKRRVEDAFGNIRNIFSEVS